MSSPAQARRRWWGLVFLLSAAAMVVWGQTVLKSSLTGLAFVVFWLVCFTLTALAILTALLDVWSVRRALRQEQRELIERTLAEARARADAAKSDDSPE